uniref:T9SS type A sorting domain-containing protein n=1 Tax=candidate division WOR-3 bacterium TaxID=2052148 RepID=A0A7V3RI85_UNCW3
MARAITIILLCGCMVISFAQNEVFKTKLRGMEVDSFGLGMEIDSLTVYQSGEWVFMRAWSGTNFGDILGSKLKETMFQSAVPPAGYITGLVASGPDTAGYVTLTALSDGGYSAEIVKTKWSGTGLQSFVPSAGNCITGFGKAGPDDSGFVYLLVSSIGQIGIEEPQKDLEGAIKLLCFELKDPQPNPCVDHTRIFYTIASKSRVNLRIYDNTGRLIKTLINTTQEPGRYNLSWGGVDEAGRLIPSGIYFLKLDAGEFSATKKLLLIK